MVVCILSSVTLVGICGYFLVAKVFLVLFEVKFAVLVSVCFCEVSG